MADTKFPIRHLKSVKTGATVKGELVLEHDLDYQLAVDGTVRAFPKSEWKPDLKGIADLLDDVLKGNSNF